MTFELLKKENFTTRKFNQRAGMINVYTCGHCRQSVTYMYADSGETPHEIKCIYCGKSAFSQFSGLRQPAFVWYRPGSLAELEEIADNAWEVGICHGDIEWDGVDEVAKKCIRAKILADYVEHYNMGGLFSRRVVL